MKSGHFSPAENAERAEILWWLVECPTRFRGLSQFPPSFSTQFPQILRFRGPLRLFWFASFRQPDAYGTAGSRSSHSFSLALKTEDWRLKILLPIPHFPIRRVHKLTNFLIVNRLSDNKFRLLGFVLAGFLSSIWTKRWIAKLRNYETAPLRASRCRGESKTGLL